MPPDSLATAHDHDDEDDEFVPDVVAEELYQLRLPRALLLAQMDAMGIYAQRYSAELAERRQNGHVPFVIRRSAAVVRSPVPQSLSVTAESAGGDQLVAEKAPRPAENFGAVPQPTMTVELPPERVRVLLAEKAALALRMHLAGADSAVVATALGRSIINLAATVGLQFPPDWRFEPHELSGLKSTLAQKLEMSASALPEFLNVNWPIMTLLKSLQDSLALLKFPNPDDKRLMKRFWKAKALKGLIETFQIDTQKIALQLAINVKALARLLDSNAGIRETLTREVRAIMAQKLGVDESALPPFLQKGWEEIQA